jgi:hypothetical protein
MKKVFKGYISPSEFEISGCPVKWRKYLGWRQKTERHMRYLSMGIAFVWARKGRKSDWEDGDYPPLEVEVTINIKERKE